VGFDIATNIDAMMAEHNLTANSLSFSQSVQRLSSGLRINSAADDAAGLAISDKLSAQVTGLNQASRNAQDGISMLQTADGAMNQISAMLQRIRELAVEGANDTLSGSDRQAISGEMDQLRQQISDIAKQTQFNGKTLLNGNMQTTQNTTTSTLLVGSQLNTTGGNATVSNISVSGAQAGATYTITTNTTANTITLTRSTDNVAQTLNISAISANQSETFDFSQLGVSFTLQTDSGGKTQAGVATDLGGGTLTIVTNAASSSSSASLQVGANAGDTLAVSFANMDLTSSSANSALTQLNTDIQAFVAAGANGTSAQASTLITDAENALEYVDTQRATFGASQNRLQYTINNLSTTSQNLSASESRIKDLNVASEMVNFTKEQILQQAGTAVLAQANQAPNVVLSLLR
jgi:flagellin